MKNDLPRGTVWGVNTDPISLLILVSNADNYVHISVLTVVEFLSGGGEIQ